MSEQLRELPPGNSMEADRAVYFNAAAALEKAFQEKQQTQEAYESERTVYERALAEYLGRLHNLYEDKRIRVRGPATIIVPGSGATDSEEEQTSDQVKYKHVDKVVVPYEVGIHGYHPELAKSHDDLGSEEEPADNQVGQPILRANDDKGRSYHIKTDNVRIRFLDE